LPSCLDESIVVTLNDLDDEGNIVASKVIADARVRDVIDRETLEKAMADGATTLWDLFHEIYCYAKDVVREAGYQRAPYFHIVPNDDGYSVPCLEEVPREDLEEAPSEDMQMSESEIPK